jgi:hypothetical protein
VLRGQLGKFKKREEGYTQRVKDKELKIIFLEEKIDLLDDEIHELQV